MTEEKPKKPVEVVESEEEESETKIRVFKLDTPGQQFFISIEDTLPDHLVLINLPLGVAFAIPYEFAHQLTHMMHEALEDLTGGDIQELTTETTYH